VFRFNARFPHESGRCLVTSWQTRSRFVYAPFVSRNSRDTQNASLCALTTVGGLRARIEPLAERLRKLRPHKPILPPSESDLVLLKPATICTSKSDFIKTHPASIFKPQDWGAGQERFSLPTEAYHMVTSPTFSMKMACWSEPSLPFRPGLT